MPFGIGQHPPNLHINCSLHVCGRVQGSQIFKWNSIISICSKVMAFLVISLSLSSCHCPRHPHIIPMSSPSSLSSPHHPHSPHVVAMAVVSVVSTPCCPCGPHIVPIILMSSRRSPHHPQPPRYPLNPPPPPWGVGAPNH